MTGSPSASGCGTRVVNSRAVAQPFLEAKMLNPPLLRTLLGFSALIALGVPACGGSGASSSADGTGGAMAGAPRGGASNPDGGTPGVGGLASGGGSTPGGAPQTTAGQPSAGGPPASGGALGSAGTSSPGGVPGGTTASGGSAAAGGSPAPGGSPGAAGDGGVGGRAGAGGSVSSGGTAGVAGSPATGGLSGMGGGAAAGGSEALGGGFSTGGRPDRVTPAPGATLVTVDTNVEFQQFEGWGTSLCWWANRIGGWSTENMNQFLELVADPVRGLGYNIFRYNIGGGDAPSHDHMREYGDVPGFLSAEGTWDWNADARQRAVLTRLAATGQDVILEAFSNSPPYWMTKSGCASGSSDGSDNLRDDAYDTFADYLTEVVAHYRDEWGITFRTLEPLNEPDSSWWTADGSQEGCHFGASSQARIIQAVGAQLEEKGLVGTRVSASDENSMDTALSIISGYDATTLGFIGQLNVHSYAGSKRSELRELAEATGKRLWQSESGPLSVSGLNNNTDAAIFMAGRIIQDLRELQPAAWIDWQTVDSSNSWTSFSVNDGAQTGTPLKRFYMHAAFSRFIRPGSRFVDIDDGRMVAALTADRSRVVVVVLNAELGASVDYTFDLTELPSVGDEVEVYRTSASEDLAPLPPLTIDDWSFTASAAPYSVTTYVIPVTR